jgi:hypothetical protein
MLIITEPKEMFTFSEFMTRVSIAAYKSAAGNITDLMKAKVEPTGSTQEIGLATGQVVHDEVIKLTKDMDKDMVIKILAQLAATQAVQTMVEDKQFCQIIGLYSKMM